METPSFWLSKRFFVAILAFLGQVVDFVSYGTMNIAIVAMTSGSTTVINNQTVTKEPEFNWDSRTVGLVLGANPFGSICGLFGGYLALKCGGSTMMTVATLTGSIVTLLVPSAAYCNVYLLCAIKLVSGICVQIKYASNAELWRHWAPFEERSRLISIAYSGVYAGDVISYPLCGYIIHRFGWPVAFYFSGGLSLLWTLVWFLTVPNDPSNDKFISQNELKYIQKTNPNQERKKLAKVTTIFRNMIKSRVILAEYSLEFVCGVGFTVVVTCLPLFIKDITNESIDEVGILACIPNFLTLFAIPLTGYAADTLQNKGLMTMTQIHKLFAGIGCIGGSALLLVTTCYSSTLIISVGCLTMFKLLISFSCVVAISLANYVTPDCASLTASFCDAVYYIGNVTSATMVGFIVTNHDISQWNTTFCAFAVVSSLGGIIFVIYGSSEPQPQLYTAEEDSINCHQAVNRVFAINTKSSTSIERYNQTSNIDC